MPQEFSRYTLKSSKNQIFAIVSDLSKFPSFDSEILKESDLVIFVFNPEIQELSQTVINFAKKLKNKNLLLLPEKINENLINFEDINHSNLKIILLSKFKEELKTILENIDKDYDYLNFNSVFFEIFEFYEKTDAKKNYLKFIESELEVIKETVVKSSVEISKTIKACSKLLNTVLLSMNKMIVDLKFVVSTLKKHDKIDKGCILRYEKNYKIHSRFLEKIKKFRESAEKMKNKEFFFLNKDPSIFFTSLAHKSLSKFDHLTNKITNNYYSTDNFYYFGLLSTCYYKNSVFLYGGSPNSVLINESCYTFDLELKMMNNFEIKKIEDHLIDDFNLLARKYSGNACVNNEIFIFGGIFPNQQIAQNVKINMNSKILNKLTESPEKFFKCFVCVAKNIIYVTGHQKKNYGRLYSFDHDENKFSYKKTLNEKIILVGEVYDGLILVFKQSFLCLLDDGNYKFELSKKIKGTYIDYATSTNFCFYFLTET